MAKEHYYIGDEWNPLDFSGSAFNADNFEVLDGKISLKSGTIDDALIGERGLGDLGASSTLPETGQLSGILQTVRNCLKWLVGQFNASSGHKHNGTDSAKVAYTDLSGTPTIPIVVSTLESVSHDYALAAVQGYVLNNMILAGQRSYVTTAGTAAAFTLADTAITGVTRVSGARVYAKFHAANSANATLNVNDTGAAQIRIAAGTALTAGQIPAGAMLSLVWNGTYWLAETLGRVQYVATEAAAETASNTFADTLWVYAE